MNERMLIDFYIILFVGAIISLIVSIKTKHLLPGIFATILFLVLALQGFAIEFITASGATIVFQEIVLVYVNYLFAIISFFVVLIGMVKALRGKEAVEKAVGLS